MAGPVLPGNSTWRTEAAVVAAAEVTGLPRPSAPRPTLAGQDRPEAGARYPDTLRPLPTCGGVNGAPGEAVPPTSPRASASHAWQSGQARTGPFTNSTGRTTASRPHPSHRHSTAIPLQATNDSTPRGYGGRRPPRHGKARQGPGNPGKAPRPSAPGTPPAPPDAREKCRVRPP